MIFLVHSGNHGYDNAPLLKSLFIAQSVGKYLKEKHVDPFIPVSIRLKLLTSLGGSYCEEKPSIWPSLCLCCPATVSLNCIVQNKLFKCRK